MAKSYWAKFFTTSSGRQPPKLSVAKRERQQARRQRFVETGRPGVFSNGLFGSLRPNAWGVERSDRRKEVRTQYNRQRKKLHYKRRLAERDLERNLAREKREIENYYRLHELPNNDPRLKKRRRQAEEKFALYEKRRRRKFDRAWEHKGNRGVEYKALKKDRNKQYKDISEDMTAERRRQAGLPGQSQSPWK